MREQVTGEADLNFLGSSYGTTIAADYIKAFPDRIGHIVLDSPTNNSPETDASTVAQYRSINEHLLRLVDGYADARGLTRAAVVRSTCASGSGWQRPGAWLRRARAPSRTVNQSAA